MAEHLRSRWPAEAHNFILLCPNEDQDNRHWSNCSIMYKPTGSLILIEDDQIAKQLLQEMFDAGVPILTSDEMRPWLRKLASEEEK